MSTFAFYNKFGRKKYLVKMSHPKYDLRQNFLNPTVGEFIDYKGCILSPTFHELQEKIYNMEVREDDVWIMSYPKTGKFCGIDICGKDNNIKCILL